MITNPTHIALKHDILAMGVPKLIAKNSGNVAKKIKYVDREHKIPVVENKEVASKIYKLVENGQGKPAVLYQAVAEIFMTLKNSKQAI